MHPSDPAHPPVAPLTRCLYAGYLSFGGLALACAALACGEGSPGLFLRALAALLVALLLRERLDNQGLLTACAEEDDTPVGTNMAADPASERLHARLVAMERRRGTPAFDPWEFQALRRRLDERRRHD